MERYTKEQIDDPHGVLQTLADTHVAVSSSIAYSLHFFIIQYFVVQSPMLTMSQASNPFPEATVAVLP